MIRKLNVSKTVISWFQVFYVVVIVVLREIRIDAL